MLNNITNNINITFHNTSWRKFVKKKKKKKSSLHRGTVWRSSSSARRSSRHESHHSGGNQWSAVDWSWPMTSCWRLFRTPLLTPRESTSEFCCIGREQNKDRKYKTWREQQSFQGCWDAWWVFVTCLRSRRGSWGVVWAPAVTVCLVMP